MAGWKGRGKDGRSVTECRVWQTLKGCGKDGRGMARMGRVWLDGRGACGYIGREEMQAAPYCNDDRFSLFRLSG